MSQNFLKKCDLSDLTPEQSELFQYFKGVNIIHETWEHPPVFTTQECEYMYELLIGGHCKSLFLRDKGGRFILAIAHDSTTVDLKNLHKTVECKRFSFVKPDVMEQMLGVTPGSVTPFALLNDTQKQVEVLVDSTILEFDTVYFHPLKNDKTTGISKDDLLRFLDSTGHGYRVVNLANPV